MLFRAAPPVDRDEFDWLLAMFAWLDRTLGMRDREIAYRPSLFLPDHADLNSARTASELFGAVKKLAGMETWEVRLERYETTGPLAERDLFVQEERGSAALGTFHIEGDVPVISYDASLASSPDQMAATFAHELAHLMLATLDVPPGGEELLEHATDCTAIYLGFGALLANSARQFEQFSDTGMQGWRSSQSGYLSERALVTGLAIFCKTFEFADAEAKRGLKGYLQKDYMKAAKFIDKRHPDIRASLGAVDLENWV